MTVVISFQTGLFDTAAEPENPFNPIAGRSGLVWLQGKLDAVGYTSTEPDAEDWGWYIDVTGADASYMVGAIAFTDEQPDKPSELEWLFQVDKSRSVAEKLFGKNKIGQDDALVQAIFTCLNHEDGIHAVAWQDAR